jgi:hypothetical protein
VQFRCLLLVTGVLVAAGGACRDDEGGAVPVTTVSTVADATTTTEAATTTTVDFETEVKLAALALIEVRNEVLMAPDVARVGEYISEFCTCLERERQIIADLAAAGRRWTGPAIEPLGITVTVNDEFGTVVTIAATQPAGQIVGPEGSVTVPEESFAPYRIDLLETESGVWRINGLEGISLGQEAFDAIVAEGLP